LLHEKREAAEGSLSEHPKKPAQESVEERKARLRAQRDLLVKQKQEKRQAELGEFKNNISNKDDLHSELRKLDEKTKAKSQFKQGGVGSYTNTFEGFGDDDHLQDSPEVDKRLAMYKQMRHQIMKEEEKEKEDAQRHKMEELTRKIEKLELVKKEKEEKMKMEEEKRKAEEAKRGEGNKAFLSNI